MATKHARRKVYGFWHAFWRKLRFLILGAVLGLLLLTVAITLPLRWINPPTSAYMWLDSIRNDRDIQYQWRAYEQISDALKLAVIAAEDQRFPEHFGFDWQQIQSAVQQRRQGDKLRGASTLTQQVARNLYLWQGTSSFDKWLRKGVEAWLAMWLEITLPKDRILAIYLNIAEMAPAIYGAEAASQHYFGRSADQISNDQAVALAAVLPNPAVYSPLQHTEFQRQRRDWIATQMSQLGGTDWLHAAGL